MKRTISFGKYAVSNPSRKANEICVDIEIRDKEAGPELSICGEAWNTRHTDTIYSGQCLDTLEKYLDHDKAFMELHRLWKNYHLNGMNVGTIEQDKAIEESKKDGTWEACQSILDKKKADECSYAKHTTSDYDVDCEVLKGKKLYEVKLPNGTMYRYGHGWLYRSIPSEDLAKIFLFLDKNLSLDEIRKRL